MDEILGRPLDRIDAPLKVRGRATYAYEQHVPDPAYAVLAMSSIAKGRIASIDSSVAEQSPGVLLVMTHRNSPKLPTLQAQKGTSPTSRVVQVLQDAVVHYANQPIALVVAETLEQAQEGVRLLKVRYATETHHVDLAPRAAQGYAPPKAGGGGDPPMSQRGDVAGGLREASVHSEHVYTTPAEVHNPMEPHATIAFWDKPDHLILYDATQGVFSDQERVAGLLGIPPVNVRVISPYLGGGFGSKGPAWSHVILAALAARQLNRAVKLGVERPQMFGMLGYRSPTNQTIAAGARADGTLTSWRHDTLAHTSSFDEFVETSGLASRMLYAVANNSTSHKIVKSDVGTPSFMRAPGEASGTFALESAMDEMAHELTMDPIEFRLKNYAEKDPEKDRPWSSKSLRECYRVGAERFEWSKRQMKPRATREGHEWVGRGMATAVYPTKRSPSSASARLSGDGLFSIDAGTQDLGTGTYTIMTQIAAQTLGVPVNRVRFRLGDTLLPKTPVSGGSQTAASTGSAVYAAAQALREKLIQLAVRDEHSPLAGVAAQDISFDNGKVSSKINPDKNETFDALLGRSGQSYVEAKGEAKQGPEKDEFSMYAFGAHFAEVRVDEEFGQVRVSRMLGCFSAGKILNAKTARSQLLGGMVWGVSMALHENAMMDDRLGRWVNNNLAEYHVPVNADIEQLEAIWVEEEDHHINPIGAKGIGEIGITGAAAALANAVFNATGKRVRSLPITLDKVMS